MKLKALIAASCAAAAVFGASQAAAASRDYISIVGSSTVYPFATVVAERFGRTSNFSVPKIESTGSGGGLKLFCAGVGENTPDITNASRKIKSSEIELCAKNGVKDIVEIKIGYDGIAFANSKKSKQLDLTLKDIFLALAKVVPDGKGNYIDNPYKTWSQVNPALPNKKIEVLGPPPTSGTRDAFVELAMEGGCKTFSEIKALKKSDKKKYKAICHGIREDGAFIEAGENDNLIVQKLEANPAAFGIFGFSFLDQNSDKVQGSKIAGVTPTFNAIGDGSYPVSRSLYFYVKKAHEKVIPGLKDYVRAFTSEDAIGDEGYLADRGLIPLSARDWKVVRNGAMDLTPNL
ncbi:Periplasmic phosphate binding protein [Vibrio nigripulchritudo SO65]|uniref:PstS family phosphate ABC transporter substrate-binding protein n=1 Tax=Vibrio nigripulchritudo TaxID=28173 RepID=UPI0003B1C8D8|nr:PstS family phosphate ABC transporter substrate-binding protein [Vibrio nigripulchritudo]CCN33654.1 Periplasmic phosphate binding protein [Vibrio nigripulchritudo AM115]CCN42022.1 Periplasmic phosphate binding protein [Vibrio nigripulchritudo FTn2]CCN67088.1 Periplasmic phosphate binding protein [Vibrio nigripulchritudo POn4]CCN78797.1 Periplasmic phosphate binding protein [Vibrio nigripulchritudo SO65]